MFNIEYKSENGEFPVFFKRINGKKVAVLFDFNTKPYALDLVKKISGVAQSVKQSRIN